MSDFFGADHCHIIDTDFSAHPYDAANFLLKLLRDAGHEDGLVVDIGSGSGVLAEVITQAGYGVLGIDVSPSMVDLARQRVPRATFRCESALETSLPAAVAVSATGEALNFFGGLHADRTTIFDLLARIADSLLPGGVFLCDVTLPGILGGTHVKHRWHEREGRAMYVESHEDVISGLLSRQIVTWRQVDGDLWRRTDERHSLRLYPLDWLAGSVASTGLSVSTYDDYPHRDPSREPMRGRAVVIGTASRSGAACAAEAAE